MRQPSTPSSGSQPRSAPKWPGSGSGYDLRKTAITHQVERGLPVYKIADWAGTSERMIWEVYRKQLEEVADVAPVNLDRADETYEGRELR